MSSRTARKSKQKGLTASRRALLESQKSLVSRLVSVVAAELSKFQTSP
jgi:hypothetical protein